jgi:fructosamine-3-kinase
MLHQLSSPVFGLAEDNYMGALPQYNGYMDSWPAFFIQQRLEPQVKLAVDKGLLSARESSEFEKVYQAIPSVFPYSTASLLHGDLWSGNFLCDDQYRPVLIDPVASILV